MLAALPRSGTGGRRRPARRAAGRAHVRLRGAPPRCATSTWPPPSPASRSRASPPTSCPSGSRSSTPCPPRRRARSRSTRSSGHHAGSTSVEEPSGHRTARVGRAARPSGRRTAVAGVVRLNRPDQLNPIDGRVLDELDAAVDRLVADRHGPGHPRHRGRPGVQRRRRPQGVRGPPAGSRPVPAVRERAAPDLRPAACAARPGGGPGQRGDRRRRPRADPQLRLRHAGGGSARIGDGHLNFGQMGGGGVLTLLPRVIGRARAAELMLSGRFLAADEASAVGPGQPGGARRGAARRRTGLRPAGGGEEPAGRGQRQAGHERGVGGQRQRRRRACATS